MNPGRYFIPPLGSNQMMYLNNNLSIFNLFNRFSNSIKNFNWKGMLNGVNKTLNVVNQTIPLVKEAKPMYDNVKSMLRLTKAFKNETKSNINYHINNKQKLPKNTIVKENNNHINKPIFFI